VTCHMLRRSFASACIQAGVDLIYTKSLMNHCSNSDVTLTSYVTLAPSRRLEAAQKVADFLAANIRGSAQSETKLLTDQRVEELEEAC
jgi:site-specific recombinase XerD